MAENTRKFEVLRLSVLSHCNFACVYCAPKNKSDSYETKIHFISTELLESKIKILITILKLKEVHLTGGEPTLHKEITNIIQKIRILGIDEVALTSNGFFNMQLIDKMKDAGLTRMNFSLDSINQYAFEKMSDRKIPIENIKINILHAKNTGLDVKINCTVLNGYNQNEILPLLDWAGENEIPIRYLEFMKMGPLQAEHSDLFFSSDKIKNTIKSKYKFKPYYTEKDSTATYHQTENGYIFGIIANHSEPFCEGCNRLRMDSFGRVYGCLSDQTSFELPENLDAAKAALAQAMLTKKNYFTGSKLSMKFIGG
ncbi:GTP 3',8-cyclase MoaA [Leptospira sp. 96542]|nr:GTP 3',8-cyclase MoaA [Leptospira sp. 96542]